MNSVLLSMVDRKADKHDMAESAFVELDLDTSERPRINHLPELTRPATLDMQVILAPRAHILAALLADCLLLVHSTLGHIVRCIEWDLPGHVLWLSWDPPKMVVTRLLQDVSQAAFVPL